MLSGIDVSGLGFKNITVAYERGKKASKTHDTGSVS